MALRKHGVLLVKVVLAFSALASLVYNFDTLRTRALAGIEIELGTTGPESSMDFKIHLSMNSVTFHSGSPTVVSNATSSMNNSNSSHHSSKKHKRKKRAKKNRDRPKKDRPKNFTHFISHIPKSGGNFALFALNQLLFKDREYWKLPEEDRFRGCNEAIRPVHEFQQKYRYQFNGIKCTLWMSEWRYSKAPQNIYTIVREPREHVLSQYFHCTESEDHRRYAHHMPNLTEWLEAWVKAKDDPDMLEDTKRYRCYNPVESQSKFVYFNHNMTVSDLRQRYTVIGDTAEMALSVCLMYVRYTGWVPQQCNCSSQSHAIDEKLIYQSNAKYAHGVTNHGATYETTPYQDELIAKLRTLDNILYYNVTKQLMLDQVARVESEFGVKLCHEFRNEEDNVA